MTGARPSSSKATSGTTRPTSSGALSSKSDYARARSPRVGTAKSSLPPRTASGKFAPASAVTAPKRARTPAPTGAPDTKRARVAAPESPGSSRSRRSPVRRVANGKARTASVSRNTLLQQANVQLTVDGAPVPADVKATNVVRRLFGQEIQCVMHAFGETRACARDTLELVEDAVRDGVRRVLVEAVAVAELERTSQMTETQVHVRHVAHVIRRDARAMYRFNQTLKLAADLFGSRPADAAEMRESCQNKPVLRPWEAVSELAKLPLEEEPESDKLSSERQFMNDPWKYCTWKAYHMFRSLMPGPTFSDYMKCRSTYLVHGVSRSQFDKIADHPRIYLFQKWLDVPATKLSLATWHALGHIAWECVGILTQTALIQKHYDDVAKGLGDPRAAGWTHARHILAALGHGIATAVLIPLSDAQLMHLRQEVERLPMIARNTPDYLRGNASGSRSLLPVHIREALRRRDFSDSALLNIMRGCHYISNSL